MLQIDALQRAIQGGLRAVPPAQAEADARLLAQQGSAKAPGGVAIAIGVRVGVGAAMPIGQLAIDHAQLAEEIILGDGLLQHVRSLDALRQASEGIVGVVQLQQATRE